MRIYEHLDMMMKGSMTWRFGELHTGPNLNASGVSPPHTLLSESVRPRVTGKSPGRNQQCLVSSVGPRPTTLIVNAND